MLRYMPAALLAAAALALEAERKKVDAASRVKDLRTRGLKHMFGYPPGLGLEDFEDMDPDQTLMEIMGIDNADIMAIDGEEGLLNGDPLGVFEMSNPLMGLSEGRTKKRTDRRKERRERKIWKMGDSSSKYRRFKLEDGELEPNDSEDSSDWETDGLESATSTESEARSSDETESEQDDREDSEVSSTEEDLTQMSSSESDLHVVEGMEETKIMPAMGEDIELVLQTDMNESELAQVKAVDLVAQQDPAEEVEDEL